MPREKNATGGGKGSKGGNRIHGTEAMARPGEAAREEEGRAFADFANAGEEDTDEWVAEWAGAAFRDWIGGMTDAQREAARFYMGSEEGSIILDKMRRGEQLGADEARWERRVQALAEAGRMPEDAVVYRGVRDFKATLKTDDLDSLVGRELRAETVWSTTFRPEITAEFTYEGAHPAVFRIEAPRGSKGAYLGTDRIGSFLDHEREFLMPRGTRFRVRRISTTTTMPGHVGVPTRIIHLEVK